MRRHRLIAPIALACLALALATGLAACSDDSDGSSASVPVYHEGDSISVDNGQEFVIALDANPSTGYTWDAGDNPNVTFVSSKQVSAKDAPPGASGTQQMTFKADKTGSSTLELAYARQFEGGIPPAKTVSFDVKVT
jgi:inhibitor of cysteine peptidase